MKLNGDYGEITLTWLHLYMTCVHRCCRDHDNGSEFFFTASGILNWLQTSSVITATTPLRDPTLVTRRLAGSPFRVSFYMIPCWFNMSLFPHIILHDPPTRGPLSYAADDGQRYFKASRAHEGKHGNWCWRILISDGSLLTAKGSVRVSLEFLKDSMTDYDFLYINDIMDINDAREHIFNHLYHLRNMA